MPPTDERALASLQSSGVFGDALEDIVYRPGWQPRTTAEEEVRPGGHHLLLDVVGSQDSVGSWILV